MSRPCSIALAGLSPAEQALIEAALFPRSGSPIPGARLEPELARAQLIIASADDAAAVAALKARDLPARVLLLGGSDRGTGWPFVLRPLRMRSVLDACRQLLELPVAVMPGEGEAEAKAEAGVPERGWLRRFAARPDGFADTMPVRHLDVPEAQDSQAQDFAPTRQFEPAGPEPAFAATRAPMALRKDEDDFQATQQFTHSVPSVAPSDWEAEVSEWERVGVAASRPAAHGTPVATPAPGPRGQPVSQNGDDAALQPGADTGDRVLIVGAPGNAADGLVRTLRHAGFRVDFAAGAEAAFKLMGLRAFRFVILIEVSLGSRAIALCRAIQSNRGLAPADLRVVIVASHRGLSSRIRAQLAGCSAWLEIPLKRAALIQYLRLNGTVGARQA